MFVRLIIQSTNQITRTPLFFFKISITSTFPVSHHMQSVINFINIVGISIFVFRQKLFEYSILLTIRQYRINSTFFAGYPGYFHKPKIHYLQIGYAKIQKTFDKFYI